MTRKTFGKKNPNLSFYPAVRAGDFIFISGQVPKDAEGNMFSGTIEEETKCCIDAVRRALREAGAGPQRRARAHGRGACGDRHQDRNRRHRL
jgi:enamine deaminase RidA (YjgF/YER057c/UK114 family)